MERVQKNACRNILQERYTDYDTALRILKLDTLDVRREKLLIKYDIKCTKQEETKHLFPLNTKEHEMNTRQEEK